MAERLRVIVVLGAATLIAAALAISAPAGATEASQEHPDLSGFWNLAARTPRDETLMRKLGENTVILDDTGATELPIRNYGGLKVKPAALAAAHAWQPKDEMTVSKACSPPSIIYAMQGPFPMEIHQGRDLIVFRLEYFDLVRVIFMDGRDHPPAGAPHSRVGHSIGRWEGDTLVVETTHLSPSTLTNNGLSHSDQVRLVERFRLAEEGRRLLSTQEFSDPEVLDTPGARFIAWTREPGEYIYPYDCDPTYALEYAE